MPGLKRTSTYLTPGGAKKARSGKKTTTAVSTVIPRGINLRKQVIAPTMLTTMRYNSSKSISSTGTGAAPAFFVYRMSPYDPQYTLGGTQPRGYNQLESLYHDYVVESVSIEVRFAGDSSSHRPYCFIAARGNPDASINWADVVENPDRVLSKKALSKVTETADSSTYLTMTVNPKKILGIKDPTDSRVVTDVVSSPEADYYYLVGACDPHATTGSCSVRIDVTLTYTLRFMNPRSLNASS